MVVEMSRVVRLVRLLLVGLGAWLWAVGGTSFALALESAYRTRVPYSTAPFWAALLLTAVGIPGWLVVCIRVAYTDYVDGQPWRRRWDVAAQVFFLLGLLVLEVLPLLAVRGQPPRLY
ncbi:hypothetical protein MUN81_06370 [Hymenobacter sp. 5317J-9]|uniref:hypothetical protein n=1 Tax=Hymenobacter sp. 5317J-9 TaxID=2932250 RepID=UPI001FD6A575|nr:hypothetical protein [Hymenobacter sp. 5317J-9]UOQ99113.1 hypothetical protein MUN81_06370 [Hymenobacter sp. 5317J-9]